MQGTIDERGAQPPEKTFSFHPGAHEPDGSQIPRHRQAYHRDDWDLAAEAIKGTGVDLE